MSAAVGSMSSTLGTIPFSVLSPGSADLSMAQRVALMPPSEQARVLDGLDPEALIRDWSFWARPNQLPPEGKWNTWLCVAGRGFGKNRTASEWINQRVRDGHAKRVALLGRTAADVRDVIINGESGIIAVSRPGEVPIWEPSKRRLTWPNGAFALAFSADEPDQLRGPQFDSAVADEFASYPQITGTDGATAFDNLRLGLRLPVEGDMPRMILTTTPRRVPAMYAILEQAEDPDFGIVITRGTTYDNLANLADSFRSTILGLYEGTRLGQQELLGEMLQDIEGAMFSQSRFDDHRVTDLPVARMYGAVGVDPSVAERPKDECGIVVVKATRERDFYRRHLYTVEDASLLAPPSIWAKRVVQMSRKWGVPVVAEGNQGGELVRMAIGQVDSNVPVYIVHAKSGKATRAEPIAALTEQGRMHMVGWHSLLESQACLRGSTTVVTPEGPRSIESLVDQGEFACLAGSGEWVTATAHGYGVDEVFDIEVSRYGAVRHLYATGRHRWFVDTSPPKGKSLSVYHRERMTSDLAVGDRLVTRKRRNLLGNAGLDAVGVQAGIVFGDGWSQGKTAGVALYGDKQALLPWFGPVAPVRAQFGVNPLGTPFRRLDGLVGMLNDAPDYSWPSATLLGWLAGYFATDGSISKDGQCVLTSTKRGHVETARHVAMLLGVGVGPVTGPVVGKKAKMVQGREVQPGPMWKVSLAPGDLREHFFLLEKHRLRWLEANRMVIDAPAWRVRSITPVGCEETFCLNVPGDGRFVLDETMILSGNSSWVPAETKKSPDRVDAWTWAALSLVTKIKGINFNQTGSLRARSASAHRLPPMNAATLTRSAARR